MDTQTCTCQLCSNAWTCSMVHTHAHTFTHTHTHNVSGVTHSARLYTCMHAQVFFPSHACPCTHTHTHTHTRTHTDTHIHARTHTHTHPCTHRFSSPQLHSEGADVQMRCLVRYVSGAVKQSVIPAGDWRMSEAMRVHGVPATILPPEPRCVRSCVCVCDCFVCVCSCVCVCVCVLCV